MKEQQVWSASSFSAWLRNVVLVVLILLLGLCCYFVYRVSMVAYRVEESIVAVSSDLKEVTSTVAAVSRDVSAIREDIAKFKEKAKESVPYEEARQAIEEALALGAAAKADSSALSASAEREINALLKSLILCGLRVEVGGRTQSVLILYGWIYGEYKIKQNTLTSAEDFIDQVGTKSILGKTYYLVDQEGNRVQLSTWLMNRLRGIRAKALSE